MSQKPTKTPRLVAWQKPAIIKNVSRRDGWRCCYCKCDLTMENVTIEHFVARSVGGPNHPLNYGLACLTCNGTAGNKAVIQKIEFAIARRAQAKARHMASTYPYIEKVHALVLNLKRAWRREAWMDKWRAAQPRTPVERGPWRPRLRTVDMRGYSAPKSAWRVWDQCADLEAALAAE